MHTLKWGLIGIDNAMLISPTFPLLFGGSAVYNCLEVCLIRVGPFSNVGFSQISVNFFQEGPQVELSARETEVDFFLFHIFTRFSSSRFNSKSNKRVGAL